MGLEQRDFISYNKLLEGEGEWDIRKETLGWIFDGARRCIELPPKNLESIIAEIKYTVHHPAIPYKRFENAVGRLRHVAIGLPAGKGLCTLFNRIVAFKPKMVALSEK